MVVKAKFAAISNPDKIKSGFSFSKICVKFLIEFCLIEESIRGRGARVFAISGRYANLHGTYP